LQQKSRAKRVFRAMSLVYIKYP